MRSRSDRTTESGYHNQILPLKALIYGYRIASIELMVIIVVDSAIDHLRQAATCRSGHAGHGTD